MFTERVIVSVFHFLLMVVSSGLVVTLTYRVFIGANPDFHMGNEIRNGNTATGILVAAILYGASLIMMAGTQSGVEMFRMHMLAPSEQGESLVTLFLLIVAHMGVSLILAVISISVTLRLFGRLTRAELHAGQELKRGNVAVGIVLASVVIVSCMYVRDGVLSLSKALVPQPSMGHIEIEK
jgi:uncharacterized membrane protein YjfL (UPF0719 family)